MSESHAGSDSTPQETTSRTVVGIFSHRSAARPRHPLISAILPYSFVLLLIGVLFCLTVLFIVLQMLTAESIQFFGRQWSLQALSQPGFHLLGLAVEVLIFAALYMIMPVGRTDRKFKLVVEGDRAVAFSRAKAPPRLRFLRWASPERLVFRRKSPA